MKKTEVEQSVRQAFSNATPNDFDSVLADCQEQKGKVIMFQNKKGKKNHLLRNIAGIAAALALVVGSIFGIGTYYANNAVDSTISLDVNPSIEIQVNRNEKVLDVIPLNSDGVTVLGDMDLKGTDLDVTVNALVGSMLKNGYISEIANSILVSVDNSDPQKSAELQEKLTTEISELLDSKSVSGAVLSQAIVPDDQVQTLADKYGITPGKAQLIQQIIAQDPRYTFESLAPLTIHELNLIADTGDMQLHHIHSTGHASSKGYIGADAAKEAALNHAGLDAASIAQYACEMDYAHDRMVYEIEFTCNGLEYDCDIDALTGAVLDCKMDPDDHDHDNEHNPADPAAIDQNAALNAAFSHAGVAASNAANQKCELDHDNGKLVYEIEFTCGGLEYEYEIDALTGAVLHCKTETDDGHHSEEHNPANPAAIDQNAALNAAFSHAEVAASNAANQKCELDHNNGKLVYEIEFTCNGYAYDYEIDACTGDVLHHEKEHHDEHNDHHDDHHSVPSSQPSQSVIGDAAAQNAAFTHAGISAAQAAKLECVLETVDGSTIYEVEFTCNGYDYDYEIDAYTGAVIRFSKESD